MATTDPVRASEAAAAAGPSLGKAVTHRARMFLRDHPFQAVLGE
jgi:hypothetical protein